MTLTIITINYNNAAGLKKTMHSVLNQSYSDFEYVVIDGGSTDGSKEIIEEYLPLFGDRIKWICEPDSGIYNAMNKGIRLAQGEYIQFLNSGDWLTTDFVVEKMLEEVKDSDLLVGTKISVRPDSKKRKDSKFLLPLSMYVFYRGTIDHTSAYIRRSLFEKYGYYDETLKIVSDWKWYISSIILGSANVQFCDIAVSFFDTTGISSTNLELDKKERKQVLNEMLPNRILKDYELYAFDIEQMQRIKRYPLIYKMVYFIERMLFKYDKWKLNYFSWK